MNIVRKKVWPNAPGLVDTGGIKDPAVKAAINALNQAVGNVAARIPAAADQAVQTETTTVLTGRVDQHEGRSVLYGRKLTFENGVKVSQSEEMPIAEMEATTSSDGGGTSTVTSTTVVTYSGQVFPLYGMEP